MLMFTLALSALVAVGTHAAVSPHIVGGEKAEYGNHPYICSLQEKYWGQYYHICGAVIWNRDYMVTAAHCVDWNGDFRVVCGLHHLDQHDQHQVPHAVASKVVHPQYGKGGGSYPNDIAVLKLGSPLQYNSYVDNYRFANPQDGDFAGDDCILSGWGQKLASDGSKVGVKTLKAVTMRTISNDACKQHWGSSSIIDGHVCFLEESKSSCNGDSGGPVRCGNIITGITSWGVVDCSPSWPSVYTRVSHYHDWLSSQAGSQD